MSRLWILVASAPRDLVSFFLLKSLCVELIYLVRVTRVRDIWRDNTPVYPIYKIIEYVLVKFLKHTNASQRPVGKIIGNILNSASYLSFFYALSTATEMRSFTFAFWFAAETKAIIFIHMYSDFVFFVLPHKNCELKQHKNNCIIYKNVMRRGMYKNTFFRLCTVVILRAGNSCNGVNIFRRCIVIFIENKSFTSFIARKKELKRGINEQKLGIV